MFLTPQEIAELTGRVRYSAQINWLRANGFEVIPRADGRPMVLRTHVEVKMGGLVNSPAEPTVEPNWDAINAA